MFALYCFLLETPIEFCLNDRHLAIQTSQSSTCQHLGVDTYRIYTKQWLRSGKNVEIMTDIEKESFYYYNDVVEDAFHIHRISCKIDHLSLHADVQSSTLFMKYIMSHTVFSISLPNMCRIFMRLLWFCSFLYIDRYFDFLILYEIHSNF